MPLYVGSTLVKAGITAAYLGTNKVYPPASSAPVPEAAYNFNEATTTTTTVDLTGHGHNVANLTTAQRSTSGHWSAGSLKSTAIVAGGSSGNSITPFNSLDRTMTCWAIVGTSTWAARQWNSASFCSMGFYRSGTIIYSRVRPTGSSDVSVALVNPMPSDGLWHHYALVWDGTGSQAGTSQLRTYYDGVYMTNSAIMTAGTTLQAATQIDCDGANSNWLIDDLRLYTRVLSAAEIVADMNNVL